MTGPVDAQHVMGDRAALFERLRKLAVTLLSLCAFLLAVFLPVPAAYELWMVGQVRNWQEVPVKLDAVERKRPAFGKGPSTWRYALTDAERGVPYETGDIEPGDFPFVVMGWSTTDPTARHYRAKVGQVIRVRRAPEGTRYFLRAGETTTMSVALLLCAFYWIWLLSVWRPRRLNRRKG